jgi:hypothetical protein
VIFLFTLQHTHCKGYGFGLAARQDTALGFAIIRHGVSSSMDWDRKDGGKKASAVSKAGT